MNENIKTFLIAPEQTPDGEKCYIGSKRIVYTGEAVSVDGADIPHGKGKCVWELEGAVYEGDWVDGKMSGHGVFDSARLYVIPYESRKPFFYEGEFENGTFHGYGVQKNELAGWVFEGEFRNGRRHGKGRLTVNNNAVYEGNWENGFLSGHGTYRAGVGERTTFYEGEFSLDKFNGYGVQSSNLSTYAGEWKHGLMHGRGVFICKKYKWDGEWNRGREYGHGVFTSSDGTVFTGEWHGSQGSGRIVFPNGDVYEGEVSAPGTYHDFEGLCIHGAGIYTYADGRVYDGGFVYGESNDEYMEKVRAADAVKAAERQKALEQYRAEKKKERDERRRNLTEEDRVLRLRLEEECKAIYGDETDIAKRYEILQRAYFAAHNSGYNDAMAWELSMGGSPRTDSWKAAIELQWEVEKLCGYYELELEE